MILGSCGTTQSNDQRSASEIIDTLFNRPASPVNGRASWRDPRPAPEGRLGEAFEYRPGPPSREMSAQTETGASTSGGGGGRFSRARKAWSIRSAKNPGKGASASNGNHTRDSRADVDREQTETPIAASYAQTEAPAERKRQKERDSLLHDVTHDLGARWKAKRQDSTDSAASSSGGPPGPTHHPPAEAKPSRRSSNPLRQRADSTASSTETEHAVSQPLLGAPVQPAPPSRRPSFPASGSSRPVSIRWGDQDQNHDVRRRPSNASLAAALPRSILGLGLSEETAARAAEQPHEAQARPASAISFESLVTPPSPAA